MPRSVRRRSNKRVRVKRVNKNRSRRLGRRSSSKRVNRSRSRRRRRRTMRGGSSFSKGEYKNLFDSYKGDNDTSVGWKCGEGYYSSLDNARKQIGEANFNDNDCVRV